MATEIASRTDLERAALAEAERLLEVAREHLQGILDTKFTTAHQRQEAETKVAAAEQLVQRRREVLRWAEAGLTEVKLVATSNIKLGSRIVTPGQSFAISTQEGAQLVEVGSAELAPPDPEPHQYAALGSLELRKRLALIDEMRQRRREALAEAEALEAAAERELTDLEASQELEGANVRVAITKAEAALNEKRRATRAKRVAFEREVERTEPDRLEYVAALAEAVADEAKAARDAQAAAVDAQILEARRRTIRAYAELANALQAERDLARKTTRDLLIVEVDGSRSLRQILEFLPRSNETQRCGLRPRIESHPGSGHEFTVELVEEAR